MTPLGSRRPLWFGRRTRMCGRRRGKLAYGRFKRSIHPFIRGMKLLFGRLNDRDMRPAS